METSDERNTGVDDKQINDELFLQLIRVRSAPFIAGIMQYLASVSSQDLAPV
jgi:hypothetical protein